MPRKGKKGKKGEKGGWNKGLPPSKPTQAPEKPAWNSKSAGSAGYAGYAGSAGSSNFPSLSEASKPQKKDNHKQRASKDKSKKWLPAGQLFTTTSGTAPEKEEEDPLSKFLKVLMGIEDMNQRATFFQALVKEENEELSFRRQLQEKLVDCECKSSGFPEKVTDLNKLCPCCKSITKSIGRTEPCDLNYTGTCFSDSFCCNVCYEIMQNSKTCDAAFQWFEFMELRRGYYNLDPKIRKTINFRSGFFERAVKADSRNFGAALAWTCN